MKIQWSFQLKVAAKPKTLLDIRYIPLVAFYLIFNRSTVYSVSLSPEGFISRGIFGFA